MPPRRPPAPRLLLRALAPRAEPPVHPGGTPRRTRRGCGRSLMRNPPGAIPASLAFHQIRQLQGDLRKLDEQGDDDGHANHKRQDPEPEIDHGASLHAGLFLHRFADAVNDHRG